MAVVQTDDAKPGRPAGPPVEELFLALESPLLAYATRLLGNQAAAEDVVQEAFMKLHADFDHIQEPRRWLFRTVHNLSLNHLRQTGRIVSLNPMDDASSTAETSDTSPLPDEEMIRWEGIGLVRVGLANLDDRARELIRLKFVEELSYKEISARTGLTIGHVGYLLHHALKTVGAELAKTGVVP